MKNHGSDIINSAVLKYYRHVVFESFSKSSLRECIGCRKFIVKMDASRLDCWVNGGQRSMIFTNELFSKLESSKVTLLMLPYSILPCFYAVVFKNDILLQLIFFAEIFLIIPFLCFCSNRN